VTTRRSGTRLAAVVLLVLAWGSTFAAVKVGLESAPPVLFAGMRSVLGGAAVLVLALAFSGRPSLRDTWPAYAVLTLLNVVGFFTLQTLAILELPSGLAAVLIYLQPVLVGVLAALLLGEALTGVKVAGLLLGFAGIVVVGAGAFGGHVSMLGVGYAVTAALVWALGTIAFKKYAGRVDAWWSVALPFLVGGMLLTVGGAAVEGTDVDWSGEFWAAFAYASLVGTALSWSLWFALVGSGEAGRAASYIFFVPIVSLLIGVLLLDETLGASLLAGAALVIVGVYLVNRREAGPSAGPSTDPPDQARRV
jgi:drug/metabolite transporter (DMT)-like permease